MPSASTGIAPPRRRRRTEESAPAWNLAGLEAWAATPRSARARTAPPLSVEDANSMSEEIAALSRGEPSQALRLSQTFVESAHGVDDRAVLAVARRCRAHMFRRFGRYREALSDYRGALAIFDRLGMKLEAARTAIGTVYALGHMGRDAEAHHLATRARRIFARGGEEGRAARLDVNLGLISERSGKPRDAVAAYRRAEAIFERLGETADLARTQFNLANALVLLDRYEEALALYRSCAEAWRSPASATWLGRCQLAIGSVLFRLGHLDEAFVLLEEASSLASTVDDPELAATAALDQARAELLMERLDLAGARLDAAIRGFDSLAMRGEQAESLVLRGSLRLKTGRAEEALADWRRAGEIYKGIGHQGARAWADFWRAETLARLGRAAESRVLLRAALRTLRQRGSAIGEMEARLLLAEQQLKSRPRDAERQLALVSRRMRALRDPWLEYRHSIARALLARRNREPEPAREALERAYGIARRLQSLLPFEALRAQWLGRRNELFDLALDPGVLPPTEGASGERARWMLLWSERARMPRTSLEGIAAATTAGAAPAAAAAAVEADQDAAAFQKTREELHWLDARERARRFADPKGERSEAGGRALVAWRRKRVLALARLERHGKRLEMRASRRGKPGAYAEPDPVAIQEALADDESLLEFFVGDGELFTFVVSRREIDAVASPLHFEEIREAAVRLRQLWDRYRLGPGFIRRHEETLTATATILLQRLREIVLEPALARVPSGIRRLTISPHSWARSVPFHAMVGDDWDVRYTLSGQALAAGVRSDSGGARSGALIVGVSTDDAPSAEREARAVAREHPGSTLLLGDEATPSAVRAHWPDARFIHVAGHGSVHAADPRLSGLPLSGGTWSVHDLRGVDTRAELVVLSSCQSGETVLWGTDHQVGLLPALFEGGARAAIVSLWPADDETAGILMSAFHHEVSSGRSFGEALQSARRVVRGVKPAPYYWAPFVLYGADRRGGIRS